MPDGVGPGKGYEILLNGQHKVFFDTFKVADAVAQTFKSKHPQDLVQIRGYGTDNVQVVLPDGRLG